MKLQITQNEIDAGRQNDACCCPIALAATRAFGVECTVGSSKIEIGNSSVWLELPQEAQDFIAAFDAMESDHHRVGFKPFEFELDDVNVTFKS